MEIKEVFPRPLVKQVIFAINFPNLFYIEDKIPNLQEKIMDKFPESNLLFRRNILIADLGPNVNISDLDDDKLKTEKIWQFGSPNKYELNITTKQLDISSKFHKTYDNPESEIRFRDIIMFVVNNFLEVVRVPIISRIGLRYIDEGPILKKTKRSYKLCYNTSFALDRFNIEDATEMDFKTVVKKGDCLLRYVESLRLINDQYKVILDFDAYAENIDPKNYLEVTDNLYKLTSEEFERTIKNPIYNYMKEQE